MGVRARAGEAVDGTDTSARREAATMRPDLSTDAALEIRPGALAVYEGQPLPSSPSCARPSGPPCRRRWRGRRTRPPNTLSGPCSCRVLISFVGARPPRRLARSFPNACCGSN